MEVVWVVIALLALLAGACLYWELHPARRRLARVLDKIQGPPTLPIVGNTYIAFGKRREEYFQLITDLTKKYWPIFRAWNGMKGIVHVSDANHLEAILSSSVLTKKGYIYKYIEPWLGTGLLTASGRKWHTHRKLITPAFHFKILETFLDVFAEKSRILVKKLEKETGKTQGFNIYPYVTNCALDIICETAMGIQIDAQENDRSPYVLAIYEISELIIQRLVRPWLHPDILYFLTKDGRRFKKNLNILHSYSRKVIQERKDTRRKVTTDSKEGTVAEFEMKKKMAFLDLLLEAAQNGASLTEEDIREEVDTLMFEGHDTTSASLCWTLFLLGAHQDVQKRVHEELDSVFGRSDRLATMGDLAELKYLERVLKESLRLYPSVPFVTRVITEPVLLGEYLIPVGVQATIHLCHVHRDPKHFPNPDVFDPDNFLPDRVVGRHPFAYVPFSAGPRNCIGQKFALLEEKTVISSVLRKYRVRAFEKPEDAIILGELTLRPANGVRLAIEKR